MRRTLYTLTTLFLLSSILTSAAAQGLPVSVNLDTALPMPIGQTNTVTVTVRDVVNSTVQLTFVGLQFEWDLPDSFFIGGNSEKGAVLTASQQVTYSIPVIVPANVTPGTHKLSAYVTYRILNLENSTGVEAGWWVANIQFAYPQTQQNQTATVTGPQQSYSTETIGALAAVVAIGLVLERGRIKRLIGKTRKKPSEQPTPIGTETNKPRAEEKDEQEV